MLTHASQYASALGVRGRTKERMPTQMCVRDCVRVDASFMHIMLQTACVCTRVALADEACACVRERLRAEQHLSYKPKVDGNSPAQVLGLPEPAQEYLGLRMARTASDPTAMASSMRVIASPRRVREA